MTELAVLVPVLSRPQNVAPLVESHAKSGAPGKLWFIATAGDDVELEALAAAKANYLTTYAVTYPQKNNWAVNKIDATWYFLGADDITFPNGWWQAMMRARQNGRVLGTNDLANGRTDPANGESHSTHTAIHQSYVRQGTIDADELLCSLYHHWCVDDELLWTARIRGEYVHTGVEVPHHHPYFDQSVPVDATYQLGEKNGQADMALWKDRATRLLGLGVS